MAAEDEKSTSSQSGAFHAAQGDGRDQGKSGALALPSHMAGSGTLDRLVDTARDYAKASTAESTNKAYAADWTHFARWCRLKGTEPLPPLPK